MASYHARSFSFPSKSHPIVDELDEQFCRLRSSQSASTSSLTNKLIELKELYKCVDEFLQLPVNQKTRSDSWVDEVLDGSLRLLDICATSRDVLAQSREKLQAIQSVIRRKYSSELHVSIEVSEYLKTRKATKKIVRKCLKDLEEVVKTNETNIVESTLKEVQAITVDVFKSLLSYIGGSQKSSWSFAKLVRGQKAEKETSPVCEFDAVDATVDMSKLVKLESKIQEIDELLACLFRHLVKTRATLLIVLGN